MGFISFLDTHTTPHLIISKPPAAAAKLDFRQEAMAAQEAAAMASAPENDADAFGFHLHFEAFSPTKRSEMSGRGAIPPRAGNDARRKDARLHASPGRHTAAFTQSFFDFGYRPTMRQKLAFNK